PVHRSNIRNGGLPQHSRRHVATPMLGTSHHMFALSGTVMNSCRAPHRLSDVLVPPEELVTGAPKSARLRRNIPPLRPQREAEYVAPFSSMAKRGDAIGISS